MNVDPADGDIDTLISMGLCMHRDEAILKLRVGRTDALHAARY